MGGKKRASAKASKSKSKARAQAAAKAKVEEAPPVPARTTADAPAEGSPQIAEHLLNETDADAAFRNTTGVLTSQCVAAARGAAAARADAGAGTSRATCTCRRSRCSSTVSGSLRTRRWCVVCGGG